MDSAAFARLCDRLDLCYTTKVFVIISLCIITLCFVGLCQMGLVSKSGALMSFQGVSDEIGGNIVYTMEINREFTY